MLFYNDYNMYVRLLFPLFNSFCWLCRFNMCINKCSRMMWVKEAKYLFPRIICPQEWCCMGEFFFRPFISRKLQKSRKNFEKSSPFLIKFLHVCLFLQHFYHSYQKNHLLQAIFIEFCNIWKSLMVGVCKCNRKS